MPFSGDALKSALLFARTAMALNKEALTTFVGLALQFYSPSLSEAVGTLNAFCLPAFKIRLSGKSR